jgi:saccharopine dehydrogenase (NAD+, L-lysine-forming)
MKQIKIGIIREGKNPPDKRVPLTPLQCKFIVENFQVPIVVQSSSIRSFSDDEYISAGIPVSENVDDCDYLIGVKEVPTNLLIPNKTYSFFSHTIKKQSYNRDLLKQVLKDKIELIDWETLTDDNGARLIAFGKFAGMVGAHNGLYTYGKRTSLFDLPRLVHLKDYDEAKSIYKKIKWPPIKILLTGNGRVANGSAMVLEDMGIERVSHDTFLNDTFDRAVFTQIGVQQYVRKKDGGMFHNKEFYLHPQLFESNFAPYAKVTDLFINGIFWDNQAPQFFDIDDMAKEDFKISVIADVTCDIAPVSSVPSTIRASSIDDPVYGFDPKQRIEVPAFSPNAIDVMAIDNLPNEIPRDASQSFGNQFIEFVLPELLKPNGESSVINRATICKSGFLTPQFAYLKDYVEG